MIFFTADSHFGHKNILSHCRRPFSSLEEMDREMILRWNSRVSPEDEVYILGDLMFSCKDPEHYLRQLSGRKHLILGNHDKVWMKRMDPAPYFESIQPLLELKLEGVRLTLCHYPMMAWNEDRHGAYLIHGHIHNDTDLPFWPLLRENDHILNAGVDLNGFTPVSFPELIVNNRIFKEASLSAKLPG